MLDGAHVDTVIQYLLVLVITKRKYFFSYEVCMNNLDPELAWHSEKSNDWFVLLNLKRPIFTLLTLKIAL